MWKRSVAALAAFLALAGPVLGQARPPGQRTGPLTVFGSGSTGDVSLMSVPTPDITRPVGTLAQIVAWLSGTTNVAALRASSRWVFNTATTLGYYAAADGGGATYTYDPTDTTTADNGCTVIVGAGGVRWKLLGGTIDLRQCGAKGDDSDETAVLQTAATAIAAARADMVVPVLPAGRAFKATSTITVSGTPLRIRGGGVDPGNLGGTRGPGAWFHLAHLGVGFQFSDTGYAGENMLIGVGTFRDQPAPAPGWAPVAADYDVVMNAAQSVVDMTALNATKGFKITGNVGHRTWIKRFRCQCMQVGIFGERANDKTRIDFMDAWPIWQNVDAVNSYTSKNLDAVYMQRMDGMHGGYLFAIFANSAMRFGQFTGAGGGTGVSSEHHWDGVYADVSRHLILFDAGARYTNVHLDWATIFQDSFNTTPDYGIENTGALDVQVTINSFKGNNLRGGFAYLTGAGARLSIGTFVEGTFNRALNTTGFVAINGAQINIAQYQRSNANSTVYGTGALSTAPSWTSPNGGAPRTSGNVNATLDAGTFAGTTNASGDLVVTHNAGQIPSSVDIIPTATCPASRLSSANATTMTVRCLDIAGAAVASAAVSVAYQINSQGASLATGTY